MAQPAALTRGHSACPCASSPGGWSASDCRVGSCWQGRQWARWWGLPCRQRMAWRKETRSPMLYQTCRTGVAWCFCSASVSVSLYQQQFYWTAWRTVGARAPPYRACPRARCSRWQWWPPRCLSGWGSRRQVLHLTQARSASSLCLYQPSFEKWPQLTPQT